jgi:hypothetical protein
MLLLAAVIASVSAILRSARCDCENQSQAGCRRL